MDEIKNRNCLTRIYNQIQWDDVMMKSIFLGKTYKIGCAINMLHFQPRVEAII
jgi:hypothetical protein